MKFDLDEAENLANCITKLLNLLNFYCKQNEVEELIDEIMPLINILCKKSDRLYCILLSRKNPDMFDD